MLWLIGEEHRHSERAFRSPFHKAVAGVQNRRVGAPAIRRSEMPVT
jgi:hypothetical protein